MQMTLYVPNEDRKLIAMAKRLIKRSGDKNVSLSRIFVNAVRVYVEANSDRLPEKRTK